MIPKYLVIDVDGVMTDGGFYYSKEGKLLKKFGPDDACGLALLKEKLKIIFVSADKRGFPISEKRISDMGYKILNFNTSERIGFINYLGNDQVIYIGDGFYDCYVMKNVMYSIATNNSDQRTKEQADYITKRNGGDRAISEACLHIHEKFLCNNSSINKTIHEFSQEYCSKLRDWSSYKIDN